MSATFCRGCGQPVGATDEICANCGVRVIPVTEPVTVPAGASAADAVLSTPPQPAPPIWSQASVAPPAAASAALGRRRVALTLVMAILVGLLARVAVGAMVHKPNNGDLVAQLPVGADGASATFDNGGKITVPKGAVSKPTTINVYRRTIDRRVTALSPTGGTPLIFPPGALIVYQFGPVGLVFLQPIVVILPIPPGQNGIVFLDQNGQLRFLPGVGTGTTVRVLITSFNVNAPGAVTFAG
jgi:hypothetical protein